MSRNVSELFDFRRWWLLVTRHWVENRKKYGLFLLAYAGVLALWFGYLMLLDDHFVLGGDIQFPAYILGLYLTGCLYASTLFAELGSRRDAIHYLSVPASRLEKLLCAFLFGVPVFYVAYTAVFYLIDIPVVLFSNHLLTIHPLYQHSGGRMPKGAIFNVFSEEGGPIVEKQYHLFLMGFFSAQAVFALGTIYFRRYAIIKSILAIFIIIAVIAVGLGRVIDRLLPQGWGNHFISWVQYDEDERPSNSVFLPWWFEQSLVMLLQFGLPLYIWFITYCRLKEKEI